LQKN